MQRNAPGQPPRDAPHNLYGHGPALFALGGTPVPPSPLFEYVPSGSAPVKGVGILSMHVGFDAGYDVTYTFDGATDTWKRSTSLGPHSTVGGGQLAPTNVVVQFTPYSGEAEGNTVGEGDVWVFTDGALRVGRWVRPDHSKPARYVDAQGETDPAAVGPHVGRAAPRGRQGRRHTGADHHGCRHHDHRQEEEEGLRKEAEERPRKPVGGRYTRRMPERTTGTARVKRGLAEMLRGGVIMDVVTPEQAKDRRRRRRGRGDGARTRPRRHPPRRRRRAG